MKPEAKPKLRVQLIPVHRSPFSFDMWRESRKFPQDHQHPAGIIITGTKIKARALKRLAEIAAMDSLERCQLIMNAGGIDMIAAMLIEEALGLTSPQPATRKRAKGVRG